MNFSPADLASIGARLVGATLLWTGIIKAIAPHTFFGHLSTLGWIPNRFLSPAVTAAAGLEAGWGLAVLLDMSPAAVYPMTLVLLAVFTAISVWGVRSGRATDCGCYGGFVQPSIGQSVGLNSLFAVLVIAAWISRPVTLSAEIWQVALVILGTVAVATLAEIAQRHHNRTGKLMFDTSPLKIGNRWRHSWVDGATSNMSGETLVAFLGPDCPYCSQFVKVANAMVQSPALPTVVGVVAATEDKLRTYVQEQGIRFPMVRISQSLMGRLTQAVPTAVIVESERIENMWVGTMPPEFVDRFRDAFFPNIAEKVANALR